MRTEGEGRLSALEPEGERPTFIRFLQRLVLILEFFNLHSHRTTNAVNESLLHTSLSANTHLVLHFNVNGFTRLSLRQKFGAFLPQQHGGSA